MKILYIGHLHESSGFAIASINYIRAMVVAGLDVVCRSVKLSSSNSNPPEDIQNLLQKKKDGCSHVVQHILPHLMDYNGNMKNIAMVILESQNIGHTHWASKINLMDQAWIPYSDCLLESGITIPKKLVPHACHTFEYTIKDKLGLPEGYKFYYIGEFSKRKNVTALIKAFHLAFTPTEPVQLVLKLNKYGLQGPQLIQFVKEQIDAVKNGMKLYPLEKYKPEILISDYISREELLGLHFTCDCFVNTSYGEAWSLPTFDAMVMGSTVISNNCGGPRDFLQNYKYGYLVNNRLEPCFGALDTFKDLHTSRELWYDIDILDLCQQMRKAYENRPLRYKSMSEGLKIAENYSYLNIGNLIKNLL